MNDLPTSTVVTYVNDTRKVEMVTWKPIRRPKAVLDALSLSSPAQCACSEKIKWWVTLVTGLGGREEWGYCPLVLG